MNAENKEKTMSILFQVPENEYWDLKKLKGNKVSWYEFFVTKRIKEI